MTNATLWLDQARAHALRLRRAFDARARRERLLLIGAGIAVVWMLGDALWLTPAFKAWSAANTHRSGAAASLQRLNAEIGQRGTDSRNAEQELRNELVQTRERVAQGDAAMREFGAALVSAPEMVPMLDRLLAEVGGLRLRSMQTLARSEVGAGGTSTPVSIMAAAAAAKVASAAATAASASNPGVAPAAALYRHGVELTVEGSYADVLAYVRAIEAMPQRVLWGGLQLKVEEHPLVVVTLRLYTLSPDRNWLEI